MRAPPEHELLAQQWQLTPAEARTAIALADGLAPAQIAEAHRVAISTVRVHLKRAYAKTDTVGQRELAERVRRWRLP
jgi:DNA-binding CsgD family transcriptional regulator